MQNNRFSNLEKLKSKKEISRIFTNGIFFFDKLISVAYTKSSDFEKNNKIAISVPKKLIKSAVKRNRIKRLIRESYRLNKSILYNKSCERGIYYKIVFIYREQELKSFMQIQTVLINLLEKI